VSSVRSNSVTCRFRCRSGLSRSMQKPHNAFGPTNNWPVCSLILHCGQLILRKISKIGASRYQILRLKCTKFTFCWGSAPDPAGGAYSSPRPLPLFKGPTSKGMEGNGREEEKVKGKEGERWRERFGPPKNFGVAPPMIFSIDIIDWRQRPPALWHAQHVELQHHKINVSQNEHTVLR